MTLMERIHNQSTTTRAAVNPTAIQSRGVWLRASTRHWRCHRCGALIAGGERYLWFPESAGGKPDRDTACARCAGVGEGY